MFPPWVTDAAGGEVSARHSAAQRRRAASGRMRDIEPQSNISGWPSRSIIVEDDDQSHAANGGRKSFASSATARCGTKWITKAGLHFIRTKVNTITETDDLLKLSDFFFFEEVGSAVLPSGHS